MAPNDKASYLFNSISDSIAYGKEKLLGTGVNVAAGDVRCFRKSNGEIGLVIPATKEEYAVFNPDMQSHALHLTKLKIHESGELQYEARLSLKDKNQKTIFYYFIDEVLEFLAANPTSGINEVAAHVARWRRLFAGGSFSPMSISEEVGLLCELHLLLELTEAGIPGALERWVGPENANHDFEFPTFSIECKGSRALERMSVEIHGERQLIPTDDKDLFLEFRRYQLNPDGQLSIPALVGELLELGAVNPETLLSKLRLVGCDPFNVTAEDSFNKFFAIDQFAFHVTEEFPRVVIRNDNNRINNVRFSIDLAGPTSVPGYLDSTPYFN